MKRTTERGDLQQKDTPHYISGCRQFEGEDLCKLHFWCWYHTWPLKYTKSNFLLIY